MLHRLFAPLALLVLLTGCQQSATETPPAQATPATTADVLVAVLDARPYVAAGEKKPSFLGTKRGEWSEFADVETASGRPLAADIAERAVAFLSDHGIDAAAIPVKEGTSVDQVVDGFRQTSAGRLLVIRIEEWRSDAYTRVVIRWALEGIVFDRSGTYLGRRRIAGSEAVGQTSIQEGPDIGQIKLRQKLERLLSDPAIIGALG